MSIQTYSGLPAKCSNTIESTAKLYQDFRKGIEHLRGCDDWDLLFIPSVEDFLKYDVKNHCHPMHHEIVGQKVSIESDEEDKAYLKARYDNGVIPKQEYNLKMQEYKVKEMKRKLVFDKSVSFRDEFQQEVYLLEEYKRNQHAVVDTSKEGDTQE